MYFTKEMFFKMLQNLQKNTRVLESVFNEVKLATLLKKTPTQVFSCEFSKLLRATFL